MAMVICLAIFALIITQTAKAQQPPIIGSNQDSRIKIEIYSFNTNQTIPYYPNTPSRSGYVWAWIDMSITNLQTSGTISTNDLYGHLKDSQNYDYTSKTTLAPQELKLTNMPAGQSQRGEIYWEIPASVSITSFYWYDYTSNIVLPAPTATTSPTPNPSPTQTPTTNPTIAPSTAPIQTPTEHPTVTPKSATPTETSNKGSNWKEIQTITGITSEQKTQVHIDATDWRISWQYNPTNEPLLGTSFATFGIVTKDSTGKTVSDGTLIKIGSAETSGVLGMHQARGDYIISVSGANLDDFKVVIEQNADTLPTSFSNSSFITVGIIILVIIVISIVIAVLAIKLRGKKAKNKPEAPILQPNAAPPPPP